MAAQGISKKLHVYHILYRLNLSFSNIVRHCRALQEMGGFTAKSSRIFQGYAQELQSDMNQQLLGRLHDEELADWARFGKVRQAEEKELRDPDDIFIHAEERKQQIAKEREKAKRKKQRLSLPNRRRTR